MNNKPHLFYSKTERHDYFASSGGGSLSFTPKERSVHGEKLISQYYEALNIISKSQNISRDNQDEVNLLTSEKGIFLSIVSDNGTELDIKKFDNQSFELKTLKLEEDQQVLTFYTSNEKKDLFRSRIEQFIGEDTSNGNPKNLSMLNNIFLIRPSTLEDLWTDDISLLPKNSESIIKCEVWISFYNEEARNKFLTKINEKIYDYINETYISLPTVTIFKVSAKRDQIEGLIAEHPDIVELRTSSENPSVFIDMDVPSQHEFTDDFNQRIKLKINESNIFVSILDTGVNYNNPLLHKVCKASYSTSWDMNWDHYTDSILSSTNVYHGSFQAGVAAFGSNILDSLVNNQPIEITHEIESGRILPPRGTNLEEMYGAITLGTISNLIIDRPESQRVYSLAVTNKDYKCEGYPTSWSATIDNFCYENSETSSDVFIISAGNAFNVQKDYWSNARSAQVQDPAQAWNAITVGSCTKLYNITNVPNPKICSKFEDINPTTSSSHNWEWSDAPFKPEILCEGGNRIIYDDGTIDFHEDLSLLTASGKTQNNVFGSHTDTSAATAEASYIAAKVMSAYPEATSETIRGLMIHSSEWSDSIFEELNLLVQQHPQKNMLKEYKENILKVCGYGIPDLGKAINSKNNRLSLVIESSIKPFNEAEKFKLNEFNLHELPWPEQVLRELPLDSKVKMTVTLSYFIEPNPRVSKIKSKYVYRSHGLSFNLCKSGQNKEDFIDSINRSNKRGEEYTSHDTPHKWFFGSGLQKSGSIHKDYWEGTAAELSELSRIIVKPVTGWWKLNKDKERCSRTVNYSLIVTLDVDDNEVDIYSEVENKIRILTENLVPVDVKY
ncbi:S8 family peptidase [Psychrobacter sp. 1Y1]|uniref:S8 family peptidase n=1 Tax=Psychrobacter sp. 1Y1 TaxID=3453574 RepID=UPI003F48811A